MSIYTEGLNGMFYLLISLICKGTVQDVNKQNQLEGPRPDSSQMEHRWETEMLKVMVSDLNFPNRLTCVLHVDGKLSSVT